MTGEWIKRREPKHICDLPLYEHTRGIQSGDQWRCECGLIWVVSSVWGGDQREPLMPGEYPKICWQKDPIKPDDR